MTEEDNENPIERMKPYFSFFSDRLDIAIDMIVATREEAQTLKQALTDSKLLYAAQYPTA